MAELLVRYEVECVMHFAALAYVGESVTDPLAYYDNNTAGTISLLKAMHSEGVNRLVFSSTCATYGEPEGVPIVETMRQSPISPYGWSKWCVERILRDYSAANREFAFVAPRYFNVAGCASDGSLGEDHHPETHLIPVVLQALLGQREKVVVFGTDYPTPDGTCIRDYIHVEDLCEAHIVAMNALQPGDARFYNLGIGRGYSVKEVIDSVRARDGQEGAGGIRSPAARRPGRVVCQRPEDPRRAWLAGAAHGDRRHRGHGLELVQGPSARVRSVRSRIPIPALRCCLDLLHANDVNQVDVNCPFVECRLRPARDAKHHRTTPQHEQFRVHHIISGSIREVDSERPEWSGLQFLL